MSASNGAMAAGPESPLTVAILGSCITRDNFNTRFNPGYKQWYRPVLTQNQSSIISVMAPPTAISEEEIGTAGSEYDRGNVRDDFGKHFLSRLAELSPDYLIVDFFGDVHFGCLDLGDGRYVTDNRWKLWPTPYYRALTAAGAPRQLRLDREPELYLELWVDAFDRLMAHLRDVAPRTTVVVHRGHNTKTLRLPEGGETVPLLDHRNLARIDLDRYNDLWRRLDDHACSFEGSAVIDLTGRQYPTFDDHPWGPYFVHYTMDYYADFLDELNRIHLTRARRPLETAMLAHVERGVAAHAEERWSAESDRKDALIESQRAKLKRQGRRVKQLESRTPEVLGRKVLTPLRRVAAQFHG